MELLIYKKLKKNKKKMGSEEGYNKESENDIKSDLYGNLEIILVSILQCKRNENYNQNQNEWQKLTQELVNTGEKKWGIDSSIFNKIFIGCSPVEISCVA